MPSLDEAEASVMESLRQELLGLGMPIYQARVFSALLQLGTANSSQLAWVAGIPRTSTYQVMRALEARGLLERVAGPGPVSWTCHDRQRVIGALELAGQERMRHYEAQLRRLRHLLVVIPPPGSSASPICSS